MTQENPMARTAFATVDEYLDSIPANQRPVLDRLRELIREELPEADEVISYQIPAYKQDGVTVIYFAGWKEHFSLYPLGEEFEAVFPQESARYALTKGTIRFPFKDGLPVDLVRRIVRHRAATALEAAKSKAKARRKA